MYKNKETGLFMSFFMGLILVLYIYPLIGIKFLNPMLTILGIVSEVMILSIAAGVFSEMKVKYFYPAVTGVLFIPTVWLYYNSSALFYAAACAVVSAAGLFLGIFSKRFMRG